MCSPGIVMELSSLAIVVAGLLLYSLIAGRLQGTVVTAPLVFIIFGFVVGSGGLDLANLDAGHSTIHVIVELTLILVLFTDAARIDINRVRKDHNLPARMLIIGLPLVIAAGTLIAAQLFPDFSIWEAALLAALLAPTDAALGQSVVSAKAVPGRIRQAINIESGLNDGIALPAVLLFAALSGTLHDATQTREWVQFGLMQVSLGPLVGCVAGYLGARMLDTAIERRWSNTSFQGIGILSLAILTYAAAELAGGNGFIAAFLGGMVFGNTIRHPCTFLFAFMETEGKLLVLITFLIFGAAMLPEGIVHLTPAIFLYAVLSLTVIRIIPIMISLSGTRLQLTSRLFLGWFGPRGLASILFVLLILDKPAVPHYDQILSITVITVALSALLHGITAAPLAGYYGRLVSRLGECEETRPVAELPYREGHARLESQSNRSTTR